MPPQDEEWRLAVTGRCLTDDLRIPAGRDWRFEHHQMLVAFEERRSQEPEGQERVAGLVGVTRAPVFSLHAGDARGGTWFDREQSVVWLLGVGLAHDYDHLIQLARRGLLLPTPDDYIELEALELPADALQELVAGVRWLLALVAESPDQPVEWELARRISVRICLESGDPSFLVVAISERIAGGGPRLPADWRMALIGLFFPGIPFEEFVPFPTGFDNTFVRDDELAVRHFAPMDAIRDAAAEQAAFRASLEGGQAGV